MLRNLFGLGIGLVMSFVAATCNQGCTQYPHPVYTQQDQIDADYKAELKECVRVSKTREQSDYCQELVRWKYGVCEVPSMGDVGTATYAPCRRND